jgi:hypothetical protein
MTKELYWKMFCEFKSSGSYTWRYYDIYSANDQVKKIMNQKHLWVYKEYDQTTGAITHKLFPSREKAAQYWALAR